MRRLHTDKRWLQPAAALWCVPVAGACTLWLVVWTLRSRITQLISSETVVRIDSLVLHWFRDRANPASDHITLIVSAFGSPVAMAILAVAGAIELLYRRRHSLLASWSLAFAGVFALTLLLKALFQRARPEGAEAFLFGTSFSFPSSHALESLVGFGMLAYMVRNTSRRSIPATLVWALWAAATLIVGITRLMLGVHYLSDVVASYCAGGAWLGICLASRKYAEQAALSQTPKS